MIDNPRTVLDLDLTARDVQDMGSADAVAAFFAKLHYNTNVRTLQSASNLEITADSVREAIKRIELIADSEALFQVYLFELTNVTIAITRVLARAFRQRAGNYLLVLTTDYQKLDFVLVEKTLPTKAGSSQILGTKQVGIRPRVLTVDRVKPDRTHLRVLRRLTWTESDPFFQYDKLLSAYTVADWTEEFFNNRALFSDHYLLHRVPEFPDWREDPKPAYNAFHDLYRNATSRFVGQKVDLLRSQLFEPLFAILGFRAVSQGHPVHGDIGPHYRLFSPEDSSAPIALCRTYPWARSLDGKDDQRDSDSAEENPGAVVVTLLERSECPWVVLTNGQTWRLYSRHTHSRATNYYEVDVKELLAEFGSTVADPASAFKYFWIIFRRAAFEPKDTLRAGQSVRLSLLDRLLLESEDYAKELGERLKERVFEDVFPHLAEGFVHNIRQRDGIRADLSQAVLDEIFEGTLTLLYRLLFLLYAEARSLLPVKEERGYFLTSLTNLRYELHESGGRIEEEADLLLKKKYRDDSYSLYERLASLFRCIDVGDSSLNVPVYNGGLFLTTSAEKDTSPEARIARFLEQTKVPDRFLSRALHKLTHVVDEKRHDLVFIDYKSLGVRQLGSIYEGLLEFRLRIASEKMAIVKGKKTEEIVPYNEAKREERSIVIRGRGQNATERVLCKGEVYLENDKRERKATGSYYTPDYVVKYIVEQTVGSTLYDQFESMRPRLRQAQQARRSFFDKQDALRKRGLKAEPEAKAQYIGEELVDELFDIKVLDPAMGSGHFLVETVDFITDKALDFLNAFPGNPVSAYLSRMRDDILSEMDSQGITIDAAKLTDVNLLKRHVLKRCIYGVDLNPMAVELAKVSLWLDCFTLGAPLSFLDHHLRYGNSLVGVTVEEVRQSISTGQLSLLSGNRFEGMKQAVAGMISVGGLSDLTAAQGRQSRETYRQALDYLRPIKRLLDAYTSQWFGNEPFVEVQGGKKRERNRALEFLRDPMSGVWADKPLQTNLGSEWKEIASIAERASQEIKFFHWELEFPEVFYGPRPGTTQVIELLENGGFDAVVGNPPYVGFHGPDEAVKNYLRSYFETCKGKFDIYVPFWERALGIARPNGWIGFICPSGFMKRDHGRDLRKLMSTVTIVSIHDFLHTPVFGDALNYVCIPLVRRSPPPVTHKIALGSGDEIRTERHILQGEVTTEPWVVSVGAPSNGVTQIIVDRTIQPLSDIAEAISEGIVTGKNEVFVIGPDTPGYEDMRHEGLAKPALRGECVDRYAFHWDGTLIIYPYRELNGKTVALAESQLKDLARHTHSYLLSSREKLKGRSYFENSSKKWFELWNQRSLSHQSGDKLVIQENSVRCEFNYDAGTHFYLDTCCGIELPRGCKLSYGYLLAVLNSRLLDDFFRQITVPKAEGHFIHKPMFLRKFPIKQIEFRMSESERKSAQDRFTSKYIKGDYSDLIVLLKAQFANEINGRESIRNCDEVHDLLHYLSEAMIAVNHTLEAERNQFLALACECTGLSGAPDQVFGQFKRKSRLVDFVGDYSKQQACTDVAEVLDILATNRRKLNRFDDAAKSRIQEAYTASVERIVPAKEKLSATDALIDSIVGLLYGQTDNHGRQ